MESDRIIETESGWGFSLSLGKEWWVSENWGLGLAGFVYHSRTTGEDISFDYETYQRPYTVDNTVIGIMFSATYH